MSPTSKKLREHICLGLCVSPCVCLSKTVHARVLKFHIWIPHGKIVDTHFFFLSELSPFLELCPFEKIRMKSDACHILRTGPDSSVGRVSTPGNGRSRVRSKAPTYQSRKKNGTSCSSLGKASARLVLPTSDHRVKGLNPAGGEILPEPKWRFIAQSLSCSPFHRLEMTEILLKGCKTLTHPSILAWHSDLRGRTRTGRPSVRIM